MQFVLAQGVPMVIVQRFQCHSSSIRFDCSLMLLSSCRVPYSVTANNGLSCSLRDGGEYSNGLLRSVCCQSGVKYPAIKSACQIKSITGGDQGRAQNACLQFRRRAHRIGRCKTV